MLRNEEKENPHKQTNKKLCFILLKMRQNYKTLYKDELHIKTVMIKILPWDKREPDEDDDD